MAALCKWGGECTGCMACRKERIYRCCVCGSRLYPDDGVYVTAEGLYAGCDKCLSRVSAEECGEAEDY